MMRLLPGQQHCNTRKAGAYKNAAVEGVGGPRSHTYSSYARTLLYVHSHQRGTIPVNIPIPECLQVA